MNIKNIGYAAMAFLGTAGLALAEETGGSTTTSAVVDVSKVGEVAEAVQTGFSDAADALYPVLAAVVCIGVGLWLIPRIVGVLKSAFSSGKGR